jgi:hypothetical protein
VLIYFCTREWKSGGEFVSQPGDLITRCDKERDEGTPGCYLRGTGKRRQGTGTKHRSCKCGRDLMWYSSAILKAERTARTREYEEGCEQ